MKKLGLFILILLVYSCDKNEHYNTKPSVEKYFSLDLIYEILTTHDDGYLIAGVYDSQITFIKTDSEFDTQWEINGFEWGQVSPFDGDYYDFEIISVFQKSNGNFVCMGKTWPGGDVIVRHTLVIELDQNGNEIQKVEIRRNDLYNAIQTPEGYLLIGYKVIQLDNEFNICWEKANSSDSLHFEYAIYSNDGSYKFLGFCNPLLSKSFIFIQKTDRNGNEIWFKQIPSSENTYSTRGNHLMELNDGGYLIVGRFHNDLYNGYLCRTNLEGDTVWTSKFITSRNGELDRILYSDDNRFIIKGRQVYHEGFGPFVIEINKDGKLQNYLFNDNFELISYDLNGFFIKALKYKDGEIKIQKIQRNSFFNE